MATFSVADAKNSLPRLIDKALEGEEVVITRHGKPVVEIRPANPGRTAAPAATYAWLQARRRGRKGMDLTSVELLDQLYEGDQD